MNDNVRDMSDIFTDYGATNIHPIALVFMLCMVGLVLSSRPSRVVLGVLLVCVFMPKAQRLVVGGLDFSMIRLVVMAAWANALARGSYRGLKLGKLDLLFLLMTASLSIVDVTRLGSSRIVYRLGTSFDAVTIFFLFRSLVRTRAQVLLFTRNLAWIVIAVSLFMAYEMTTRVNAFGIFGSAPLLSVVRDGSVRSQGPFSHAILAGTFGGVVLPFFIGVFRGQKWRALMLVASVSATVIVVSSGSSGPVISWGAAVLGWGIWPLRKHIPKLMWSIVGLAVVIHVIREKPVWHLIGRLAELTGGTGYHRYLLIDAFISRFSEWALLGTSDTAYWGWGLQDTTNQYVAYGVEGGLLTLLLFILLLRAAFVALRNSRHLWERVEGPSRLGAQLSWGFSVSLVVHCVSFVSVSYFGQMLQFFYLFLAMIPALSKVRRASRRVASRRPERAALQPSPAV